MPDDAKGAARPDRQATAVPSLSVAAADRATRPPTRLARLGRALSEAFCRIAGMPDYDGYLAHWRRCHPDQPAPSRAEFFRLYLESRYGGGVGRCC
jgi:uncharacterized short protein YbdD (DUF466 family)